MGMGERVATACLNAYDRHLGQHARQLEQSGEWTVLAGIVLERSELPEQLDVLSLAYG